MDFVSSEMAIKILHACPSVTELKCALNTGNLEKPYTVQPMWFNIYEDDLCEALALSDVLDLVSLANFRVLTLDLSYEEMSELTKVVTCPKTAFPNLEILEIRYCSDDTVSVCGLSLLSWSHVKELKLRINWCPDYSLGRDDHDLSAIGGIENLKDFTLVINEARSFEHVFLRDAVRDLAPHIKSHMTEFKLLIQGGLQDWNDAYAAWEEVLREMAEGLAEALSYDFTITRVPETLSLLVEKKMR